MDATCHRNVCHFVPGTILCHSCNADHNGTSRNGSRKYARPCRNARLSSLIHDQCYQSVSRSNNSGVHGTPCRGVLAHSTHVCTPKKCSGILRSTIARRLHKLPDCMWITGSWKKCASTNHCCHDDRRDIHLSTHFEENNTRLHAQSLARLCHISRASRSITTCLLRALQSVITRNVPPGDVLARSSRRVAPCFSLVLHWRVSVAQQTTDVFAHVARP